MKNKIISLLLSVLLWTNLGAGETGFIKPDQESSDCRLEEAEESYYRGEFEHALAIIEDCLKNHSPDIPSQVRAYTISARILLVRGDSTAAEKNVMRILTLDSDYKPSIEEETPKFVNFVSGIREKATQKKAISAGVEADSSYISPWIWIGAGGAAIAIFAILSGDKSGITLLPVKDQNLPAPPAFPNE
jgi:hypothetical protein